ncbi:hypothetical protein [Pseudomonas sp. TE3610]
MKLDVTDGLSANVPPEHFTCSGVMLTPGQYQGSQALQVRMPATRYQDPRVEQLSDRDFMAWLPGDFGDGVIEVDIASDLASDAPDYARGFVGIAFRIDHHGHFESIYLRPTNSQCDDQVRRNHSVQYAAYPHFRFHQLRLESPEKYETYADIDLGRWIHLTLEICGTRAVLFLDHQPKPAFIVTDLKLGDRQRGGVGIWIESGTVCHFKDLRVTPA